MSEAGLRHAALTEKIIGAFYEVYNELGHGFLENVYENSLAIALREHSLSVVQQLPIEVSFRGTLAGDFRGDS